MGYQVPKHTSKRGWKILYTSYENGKRKYRGVRLDEYRALGVRLDMPRDEVIRALAHKNAQEELSRHEKRRNKIEGRLALEQKTRLAKLPHVGAFEKSKLDFAIPKLRSCWG